MCAIVNLWSPNTVAFVGQDGGGVAELTVLSDYYQIHFPNSNALRLLRKGLVCQIKYCQSCWASFSPR